MAHWFISHATKDASAEAMALAQALEARGEKAWIAPRDVVAGVPYPGQIKRAVEGAKGLVLLVSPAASDSTDVLQEVQIANAARVKITPIIVRGAQASDDLQYYIGVRHQVAWTGVEPAADAVAGARPDGGRWLSPGPPVGSQERADKTSHPEQAELVLRRSEGLSPIAKKAGDNIQSQKFNHGRDRWIWLLVIASLGLAMLASLYSALSRFQL